MEDCDALSLSSIIFSIRRFNTKKYYIEQTEHMVFQFNILPRNDCITTSFHGTACATGMVEIFTVMTRGVKKVNRVRVCQLNSKVLGALCQT